MPRALIIEDESTAREDLRAKLENHPEVEVVGEAATVRSARELLARNDYELVFLDIQLVGGNAFDLVSSVREASRIIFVTAYDAFALRAFEINALDYLLKPVAPERLAQALRRLGTPQPSPEAPADIPPGPSLRIDDTVFLRSGLRGRFASVADIVRVAAHDNYSEVWLVDGSKVFLRKSLKAWEDTLPASQFMRVHRTQIVNLRHVIRYERDSDERTFLFLTGAQDGVPASRDRWAELRERLGALRPSS